VPQRLVGVLARGSANLAVNLIVEVLGQNSLWVGIRYITSRRDKLLQLDASDKVLILGGHQAIAPRQQEDLVVSLRPLSVLDEISVALLLSKMDKLLGIGDNGKSTIGTS
jgi:hypothetical protein